MPKWNCNVGEVGLHFRPVRFQWKKPGKVSCPNPWREAWRYSAHQVNLLAWMKILMCAGAHACCSTHMFFCLCCCLPHFTLLLPTYLGRFRQYLLQEDFLDFPPAPGFLWSLPSACPQPLHILLLHRGLRWSLCGIPRSCTAWTGSVCEGQPEHPLGGAYFLSMA